MRNRKIQIIFPIYLIIILLVFPCLAKDNNFKSLPNDIDISNSSNGIVMMPRNIDNIFKDFDRYT